MNTFAKGMGTAILAASFMALHAGNACATLPFPTDDAGTLGKGTSQVELSYEGSTDKETIAGHNVKTDGNRIAATFGHGVADTLDLTLGFVRAWARINADGSASNDAGSADFTINGKWRFHERDGGAFAVKPQVGYSYFVGETGDFHTVSCGGWLILTKEHEDLAVSMNAGYFYNDYGSAADRDANRSSIWSLSALGTYEVRKGLKLGLDVGASTSLIKASSAMPVYALAGAIYSPKQNVDLSLGLKFGITKPEPDFGGTAGITLRF